jgi:hypothetical protein
LLSTGFKQRQKKSSETIEVYDQKNKHYFGIKGYVIPKPHYNDPKDMFNPSWENEIKNLKKGAPKKTFLDEVIRQKEKQGSPPAKLKLNNWADVSKSTTIHGHPHKDEFYKAKRLTVPAEILEQAKKRKGPDQGSYNPNTPHRI